jgi:hypothetical protein
MIIVRIIIYIKGIVEVETLFTKIDSVGLFSPPSKILDAYDLFSP